MSAIAAKWAAQRRGVKSTLGEAGDANVAAFPAVSQNGRLLVTGPIGPSGGWCADVALEEVRGLR
jgi:hypothetical protein